MNKREALFWCALPACRRADRA